MTFLTEEYIRRKLADSQLTYYRGENIYKHGSFFLSASNLADKTFTYAVDGSYGDYETRIQVLGDRVESACSCPYPGDGCKHVVAAALSVRDLLRKSDTQEELFPETRYLTPGEIREQALEERRSRAASETFVLIQGDQYKGDHQVKTAEKRQYRICFHDPETGKGHCDCPDYMTNGLGTCKHLIFARHHLKETQGFALRLKRERFVFADIYWDSRKKAPALFAERLRDELADLAPVLGRYFDETGAYTAGDLFHLLSLMDRLAGDKRVRIRENLLQRVDTLVQAQQMEQMAQEDLPPLPLRKTPYPFQLEGIRFGLYKTGVLIGDEMGLGKTLQAIGLCVLKKQLFGFSKVLVITLASLKSHWRREVEAVTRERACLVEGNPAQRADMYETDDAFFKITHYESVIRDSAVLARFNPDIIVLDEAQRIRNYSTKTADAVKQIPKKQGIVLTGASLENKLEDLYSIVQFLDLYLLTPLWQYAADHFLIPRQHPSRIAGYQNQDLLEEKLAHILIRREKAAVAAELPDIIVNAFDVEMVPDQQKLHARLAKTLMPLQQKAFLTPMDIRKIQGQLAKMRRVCDDTYLLDRQTRHSPKLNELAGIVDELVVQNGRKIVIFSEWSTMTFLIAKRLTDMGLPFVELSGKTSEAARKSLIDRLRSDPDCRILVTTDKGLTAPGPLGPGPEGPVAVDCLINFDRPWRAEVASARIRCVAGKPVHIINLVAKNSIEAWLCRDIRPRPELFQAGVVSGELSQQIQARLLEQLRQILGQTRGSTVAIPVEPEGIPGDSGEYSGENPGEYPIDGEALAPDLPSLPPDRMEAVLNAGFEFVSGLVEMATGQKIPPDRDRVIRVDRETGEVVLRLKLPRG